MPDTPITGTIAHEHVQLFTEPDPTRMAEWMQAHVKRRSVDVKGADFILPAVARTVEMIDVAHLSPAEQLQAVRAWKAKLAGGAKSCSNP